MEESKNNSTTVEPKLTDSEGEEQEDEDDYEGYCEYFKLSHTVDCVLLNYPSITVLKPANEYNIQEKIKEANQELFLEIQMSSEADEPPAIPDRKVTFRSNLEEYEPDEVSLLHSASSSDSIAEDCFIEEQTTVTIEQEDLPEDIEDNLIGSLNQLEIEDEVEVEIEVIAEESQYRDDEPVIDRESEEPELVQSGILAAPSTPVICCIPPPPPVRPATTTTKKKIIKRADSANLVTTNKYKSCCEQKPVQQILPRYAGDVSEYGLSKHQMQMKLIRGEKQRRRRQEFAFLRYQEEVKRCRANEEAFSQWLKEKLRVPRNKYANRYDDNGRPSSKIKRRTIPKKKNENADVYY